MRTATVCAERTRLAELLVRNVLKSSCYIPQSGPGESIRHCTDTVVNFISERVCEVITLVAMWSTTSLEMLVVVVEGRSVCTRTVVL